MSFRLHVLAGPLLIAAAVIAVPVSAQAQLFGRDGLFSRDPQPPAESRDVDEDPQRIERLENMVRQLTGQNEQLQYRVRQLEESGLIRGYVMMLDERIAGFPGTAFVFVTLDQQGRASLESFEKAVQDLPEILECHLLAGAHDYLMRVIYRDSADFERIHTDIITQLPGVTRVQSTLTLRTIKKTSSLPM